MLLHQLLDNYRLILASQSPRRNALLAGLDIPFEVLVRDDVPEEFPEGLNQFEIPELLARQKSEHYVDLLDERTLVLTADTIVWHNNQVLGKPVDFNDACAIISRLSGDMHEVVTGVCIRSATTMKLFHSMSKVWFRSLSSEEISYYVEKYRPMDKAGAYGIQEWIGYVAIERIEGSFYNVMGLPIQLVHAELEAFLKAW